MKELILYISFALLFISWLGMCLSGIFGRVKFAWWFAALGLVSAPVCLLLAYT